jgi:hypothetical protein
VAQEQAQHQVLAALAAERQTLVVVLAAGHLAATLMQQHL